MISTFLCVYGQRLACILYVDRVVERSPLGVLDLVWDPETSQEWKNALSSVIGYRRRTRFKAKYCVSLDCSRTQTNQHFNSVISTSSIGVLNITILDVEYPNGARTSIQSH
jgi:hypothetical protein